MIKVYYCLDYLLNDEREYPIDTEVVLKADHDEAISESSEAKQDAIKYSQELSTCINIETQKNKRLEAENLILKKKLEACKKQRNAETWQPFDGEGSKAAIEAYDKELESIS